MKILHIIETLNLGGAENFVADLCNAMVRDHEVAICCIKETGVTARKISPRITVDCLGKKEGNPIGFVFQLARYIRNAKPEVVHLHSLGALLELSLVLAFCRNHTFIITCHGHLSHYSKNVFKRAIRRFCEVPAFLSADTIVSVSDDVRKILPWLISRKVTTILNGVHVENLPVAHAQTKDTIELIYAGRLAKVKNLDCVVRAIKRVEDNLDVKLRFHILGEGPEKESLNRLVNDLALRTEVNFVGYVDDVRSWYRNSDIFILPSSYEGISIALLEAMAEALAVIVTNVGGNLEVVTRDVSGIVVESGDVEGLADAIAKLASNSNLRKQLQLNGFNTVKTAFNIEATTWKYLQLYQGHGN